jgi:hypothetical protein
VEACDGIDNNCDGVVDEFDAVGSTNHYLDMDGDGYGDVEAKVKACGEADGVVIDKTDCDDGNAEVNPGRDEVCDELDNDCDLEVDEDAVDGVVMYADVDGDGFGDPKGETVVCGEIDGFVQNNEDCNDSTNAIYPGAAEYCDGYDNDCDGEVDNGEAVNGTPVYQDLDGDGYGNADVEMNTCSVPEGYADLFGDCDDANADTYPTAPELCDDLDNDCDKLIDEVEDLAVAVQYTDLDSDGYGEESSGITSCDVIADAIATGGDCDDNDPMVNPGVDELCFDGVDNNCSGTVDGSDAIDATVYYMDADGDGYGDAVALTPLCVQEAGYVLDQTDCDDSLDTVYPGAPPEHCNGVLEDCNGSSDPDVWVPTDQPDLAAGYAVSVDGAALCIEPGSYTASLTIDRPVSIVGTADTEDVVLVGDGATVLSVVASDVTVTKLVVSGGTAVDGAGIHVSGVDNVTIYDVLFDSNVASGRGGGLFLSNVGLVEVRKLKLENNSAEYGGGLYAELVGAFTHDNGAWTGNSAVVGGGGYFTQNGTVDFNHGTIEANTASSSAGGVYCQDTDWDQGDAELVKNSPDNLTCDACGVNCVDQ